MKRKMRRRRRRKRTGVKGEKKRKEQRKRERRKEQDAQLSQRDRAAGCVIVFAKSKTLERGDNDLRIL